MRKLEINKSPSLCQLHADQFVIDEEFASLCTPLSDSEKSLLQVSIVQVGCRDSLLLWSDGEVNRLVDGHHREEICRRVSCEFKTKVMDFADRAAVIEFIVNNQLARRNLNEEQRSLLRGKRYQCEKSNRGGDRKSKGQVDPLIRENVAEKLAAEYGVSERTIKRDGIFSLAMDKIAASNPAAKPLLLAGQIKLTAKVASAVVQMAPEAVTAVAEAVVNGTIKSAVHAIQPPPKVTPHPDEENQTDLEAERAAALAGLQLHYHKAVKSLNEIRRAFAALAEDQKTGAHLVAPWGRIKKALADAKTFIAQAAPAVWCPKCSGKGCPKCLQTGWLPKSVWDGLSEEERK